MLRFLAIVVGLVGLPVTNAISAQHPNIILILADDLGSGDLGCYNPESKIPTPALDQLAARGIRFNDAHSPSAVCTPTRYSILTGRYAWRSRLKAGVTRGYSRSLIEPGRMTVAAMLKQQGYATACVGKWHLGFQTPDLEADDLPVAGAYIPADSPHAVDYTKPLIPGPNSLGFDYYFGIPASLDMEPYVFVENDRPIQQPTETIEESLHRRKGGGGYWRGGPIAPDFRHLDVLPKITEKAVNWIGQQKKEKPFFLYFPLNAPHTPWVPAKQFQGRTQIGHYGDFVTQVDEVIGEIVETVHRSGQAENTLIVVTSDNGSHWPVSDITKWNHAANLSYRGQKADIWEGGHRVPLIACWPGHISAATSSDATVCLVDFMATFAALVGAQLPADVGEDSVNILPAVFNKKTDQPLRSATIHHSLGGTFAIRIGNWKLITDNLGSGGFSSPRRVQPEKTDPQGQLYNLTVDPSEKDNVWEKYPDVVKQLAKELQQIQTAGHSR
jgi:arylsulfatase A